MKIVTQYDRNGKPEIIQQQVDDLAVGDCSYHVFEDPFENNRVVSARSGMDGGFSYLRFYPLWLVIA